MQINFIAEQRVRTVASDMVSEIAFSRAKAIELTRRVVMERIGGNSLRPRLDQAPLPFEEVADIGQRVALALHDLHKQHLVHLDVKPSNIMFRPEGTAVLVDFGLSRHEHLPDLLE